MDRRRGVLWGFGSGITFDERVCSSQTSCGWAVKLMPALTGWNMDNTQMLNPTLPDGLTWIYPDAATKALDTAKTGKGSTGFVIWALDDDSGTQPGIQVRTDEPVLDWPLRNCIMASGTRPVTGVKTCGDEQSSSKRFKLRVTGECACQPGVRRQGHPTFYLRRWPSIP